MSKVSEVLVLTGCLQFVPINPRPMLQSLFVLPPRPSGWLIMLTRAAHQIQCQSGHSSAFKVGTNRVQGSPCQCRFLYEHSALWNRGICRWKEHRKLRTGPDQAFPPIPLHSNRLECVCVLVFLTVSTLIDVIMFCGYLRTRMRPI